MTDNPGTDKRQPGYYPISDYDFHSVAGARARVLREDENRTRKTFTFP
jgi:hypothetical protein